MASDDILGNLIGAGISGATGNPVGVAASVIGLGMSIFGTASASSAASQQAQIGAQEAKISGENAGLDMQVNDQRKQAMVLASRRQEMENFRNTQRARAQGENAAVSQGAQFGTGYAGGQAQASNQGGVNYLGINQNAMIGNNIFGLDNQIDANKILLAQLGGQSALAGGALATAQGYTSLGSSISKMSSPLGNLFGSNPNSASASSGGNYSGTPGASNTGGYY